MKQSQIEFAKSSYKEKRSAFPQFKKTYDLLEKLSTKRQLSYSKNSFGAATIVSENYLALALTLAESFFEYHSKSKFWIAICDEASQESIDAITQVGAIPILYEDLFLPQADVLKYRYTILELNTAIKPFVLEHCLNLNPDLQAIAYIDPDIKIYSPMIEVWKPLLENQANCCLTPHMLSPTDDDFHPSLLNIIQSGTYNLGFIGLSRCGWTYEFLNWWQSKLYSYCVVDIPRGLFTDQKWIDLVPGFNPNCKIIANLGYNVAYWNLHERNIRFHDKQYWVNGSALSFFHFSGYSPLKPTVLSKHQNRHHLTERPDLIDLFKDYSQSLKKYDHFERTKITYSFSLINKNISNNLVFLQILKTCHEEGISHPDITNLKSFSKYILTPTYSTDDEIHTPFIRALFKIRPDVKDHFLIKSHQDTIKLKEWLMSSGQKEIQAADFIAYLEDINIDHWIYEHPLEKSYSDKLLEQKIFSTSSIYQFFRSAINYLGQQDEICDLNDYFSRNFEISLQSFISFVRIITSRPDVVAHFNFFNDRFEVEKMIDWVLNDSSIRKDGLTYIDILVFKKIYYYLPESLREFLHKNIPKNSIPTIKQKAKSEGLNINIAALFNAPTGIGESGRCFLRIAQQLPNPEIHTLDIPTKYIVSPDDFSTIDKELNLGHFMNADASFVILNADCTCKAINSLPGTFKSNKKHFGYWAWETPAIPVDMLIQTEIYDHILVPSEYVKKSLISAVTVPVDVIPHCTDPFMINNFESLSSDQFKQEINAFCGSSFVIGFAYDSKSIQVRKNPGAILKVINILREKHLDVKAIIKIASPSYGNLEFERFVANAKKLGCYLIFENLSKPDVYYFLSRINTFVSMHRAEGFGLMLLESMSLGTVAVATGHSGNLDFMNTNNALLIDYEKFMLSKKEGPYPSGTMWADPSIVDCANQLETIINDKNLYDTIALQGKYSINKDFSPCTISRKLEKILGGLNGKTNS